jgi:hypothetical protein
MGIACFVNAHRCGRLHCHITGPLLLVGAVASAFDVLAVVPVGWGLVMGGVALGTVLAYGLEWVHGKYIDTRVSRARE